MSRPITTIVNAETGETETREMDDAEFLIYENTQTDLAKEAAEKEQHEADKAALLAKLNITEDEARLLLS
jgi:hypothetical protein